jgi:hypothetical protein
VEGRFYEKTLICYEEAGVVYWTTGAPLHETIIVNRCRSEDTYERRRAGGIPAGEHSRQCGPRDEQVRIPPQRRELTALCAVIDDALADAEQSRCLPH